MASPGEHLNLDGISKSYAGRRVLTDISFSVPSGEPTAVIGENGTGKSTLLRLAAGLETPDFGDIHAPGNIELYHQEPPFPLTHTIRQILDDATATTRAALDEITQAGEALADAPDDPASSRRLESALAEAERTDAWQVDHTVEQLIEGLGLAHIPTDRTADELSGGQRARLALAWTLLRRPHVLLLDEPSNHLDDRAAQTLSAMIRTWSGPVLLTSHDRAFLDETVTSIVDLDPRPMPHAASRTTTDAADSGAGIGVTHFSGHYSDYVRSRAEERDRWQRQYEAEQDELKQLRERVKDSHQVGHANWTPRSETRMAKKFYGDRNATVVSRRVNDAQQSLDQLQHDQVRKPPKDLRFRGLAASATPARNTTGTLVACTGVGIDGRLEPTDLTLDAGARLLIEGANGAGKSTLLRIIAGQEEPTHGRILRAPRLSIGLLGQDLAPLTDEEARESAAQSYRRRVGDEAAENTPLSAFGLIPGRDENRPLHELSVGQRRRLDLAVVLASPPDVLLLDEPTNHFSLLLAEDIERTLPEYPGAVVVASHDRMLRQRWTASRLVLGDSSATSDEH